MQHALRLHRVQAGIHPQPPLQSAVPQPLQQGMGQAEAVFEGDDPGGGGGDRVPQAQAALGRHAVQKPQPQGAGPGQPGQLPPHKARRPGGGIPGQQDGHRLPPLPPRQSRRPDQTVGLVIVAPGGRPQGVQRRGLGLQSLPVQKGGQRQIIAVAAGKGRLEDMGRRAVQDGSVLQHGAVQGIRVGGAENEFLRAAQGFGQPADAGGLAAAGAAFHHIQPPGGLLLEPWEQGDEAVLGIGSQKESKCHKNVPFSGGFGPFYGALPQRVTATKKAAPRGRLNWLYLAVFI